MSDISIALVCALAENRVIGSNNQLPWRLPRDLAYFKSLTMGRPVIMGRKTFDSIGRPLLGRSNIVVTRQQDWQVEGVTAVNTLTEAIDHAAEIARETDVQEIMLIGGASLYEQALPLAHRLYLTEVHATVPGDAFFPAFSPKEWLEIRREEVPADEKNQFPCAFVVYERRIFESDF